MSLWPWIGWKFNKKEINKKEKETFYSLFSFRVLNINCLNSEQYVRFKLASSNKDASYIMFYAKVQSIQWSRDIHGIGLVSLVKFVVFREALTRGSVKESSSSPLSGISLYVTKALVHVCGDIIIVSSIAGLYSINLDSFETGWAITNQY